MQALRNKILIKIDMTQKEKYALTKDTTIFISRGWNFNLREDRATMGYVVHGNDMKEGTPVLVHYLSTEPSYAVDNENILTEEEKREGFKIRNIDVGMCFCWFDGKNWQPCKGFLITKRIFKPYKGLLVGIEHELIKKRLYVVSGVDEYDGSITHLNGIVCCVTENSDVELIFHDAENKEGRVIRTMSREIEALDFAMTDQVIKGELLIGLSPNNCSTLN